MQGYYGLKNFDASEYIEYLCSVAGGKKEENAATETAREAEKFLRTIKSPSNWEDCFLDIHCLRTYVDGLQKGFEPLAPGTVGEKIRKLLLVIEYILYLSDDASNITRCTKVMQQLGKWRKSLRKEIRQRKTELRIRSRAEVGSSNNPDAFLESGKIVRDVEAALDGTTCTPQQHKLILAYVAAHIIYRNAQRPGVVQHMTIEEYENKEEDKDGKVLIKVLHHKTSSSSGEADVVIDKKIDAILQKYLDNIRASMVPINNTFRKRLFLMQTTNEFRKISQVIQEVASSYGYHVPNATLNRKITATSLRENLPNHDALPVHRHMSHTPETSMRNYQYPELKDSVDTYNTIQLLQAKKYFSEEEDKMILKEWPIANETTPTLKCCRAIIAKNTLERTGKQVQDRWKTLYKNSK